MRVLVVASHPDDLELGCGGTMSKFKRLGYDVYGYVTSKNLMRFSNLGMVNELHHSWELLNVKSINDVYDAFGARIIDRQELLNTLVEVREKINPDFVFTHASNDVHQSHSVVNAEVKRAFKHCSILGFSFPWNEVDSPSNKIFYSLTQEDVNNKLKALSFYKSQNGKTYFDDDVQTAILLVNGLRINKPYAEAFEVIRLIN